MRLALWSVYIVGILMFHDMKYWCMYIIANACCAVTPAHEHVHVYIHHLVHCFTRCIVIAKLYKIIFHNET